MSTRKWKAHHTATVLLILILALANMGRAATCTDAATGNWSAAATWTACGGTIPQPGDTVLINGGHTVTLNTNTNVASITINLVNSKLITDGVAHTVTMTITSAHCLTVSNRGTLDMSAAVVGGEVTFTCAGLDSTHAVIAQNFASPFQGNETIKCYHCIIQPTGGDGFFAANAFGGASIDIRYTRQASGIRFLTTTSAIDNVTLIGNTLDGLTGVHVVDATGGGSHKGWTVTDNTDINGTAEGFFLRMAGPTDGLTFARNAFFGASVARGGVSLGSIANTTAATNINYNIGATTAVGVNTTVPVSNCIGAASFRCTIDHNVAELFFNGVREGAGYNDTSYNVITGNSSTGPGQGCFLILSGNNFTSTSDSCLLDSNNGNLGWLIIGGGSNFTMTNPLIYMGPSDSGTSYSVGFGEGSGAALGFLLSSMSNGISLNKTNGPGANNSTDTFVTTGTGSVGVFNNLSIGASSSNYPNPSSIASYGTLHPSSTYGDVTLQPGVISVTRRLATCDAIAFSGPGTQAHLFAELAKRWNSTNQANITPANVWNCMSAPLAAQNTAIATLGYGGTFVGAYKPKVIAAVVP